MAGPQISLEIAGIRKLKTDTRASGWVGFHVYLKIQIRTNSMQIMLRIVRMMTA